MKIRFYKKKNHTQEQNFRHYIFEKERCLLKRSPLFFFFLFAFQIQDLKKKSLTKLFLLIIENKFIGVIFFPDHNFKLNIINSFRRLKDKAADPFILFFSFFFLKGRKRKSNGETATSINNKRSAGAFSSDEKCS